jgi:molecular chaperone GrpE
MTQEIENEKMKKTEHTETTEGQTDDVMADDVVFEEVNDEGQVSTKDTIKKLRAKIKELEQESKNNLDGWARAKADYVNFTKEVEARRKDDIIRANKNLILDLLPVLDAYDMAKANQEAWQKVDSNWRVGVEYIFNQLLSVFEREGVKQIGNVGEVFDPNLHDSIETVDVEKEEDANKISQVLQKGYTLGGSVLRGARVKVTHFKQ